VVHYSLEFKQAMVKKICSPGGPSVYGLAAETGVSKSALFSWIKKFNSTTADKSEKVRFGHSFADKMKAVIEFEELDETAQGLFLRRNGFHSNQLVKWKSDFMALEEEAKRKVGRPKLDPELVAAREKIKALERELNRKEKAIIEQACLIVLLKKTEEIWKKYEEKE
jgi:transposase-like protein